MRKAIVLSISGVVIAAGIGIMWVNDPTTAEKPPAASVGYSSFTDLGTLTREQRLDALSHSATIHTPVGVFQRVDNQQVVAGAHNVATRVEDINASTQQVVVGGSLFIRVE
ncbi:hypothetical protein [Paenibacillus hunanensis]|uniref:Uncharacterized protein n=2 Tax=Paenibacillus hunanensis TaxID=539262 RepID=A0ABU1IZ04_9BACL|nr:hypothetical protein [Paenibacillus hunanensis]MDR6244461.1 hypothetical protein [Paenibacillus hunanensis]GGI99586.1 hypothetical protein GCM10008022_05610 [Paenibacillus hunanensis]